MAPTLLIVGGAYVDEVHTVATFPKEDSTTRAISVQRRRGGNAATTACVLAQLMPESAIRWIGALPANGAGDDDAVKFMINCLIDARVDPTIREQVTPDGMGQIGVPCSTIIFSKETGSRTIVSSRRGLRELSPEWFSQNVIPAMIRATDAGGTHWIHFETREFKSVSRMVKEAHGLLHTGEDAALLPRFGIDASASSPRGGPPTTWRLSVEIEKPAIAVDDALELACMADLTFFSRDWAEAHAAELLDASPSATAAASKGALAAAADAAPGAPPHRALRILHALARRAAERSGGRLPPALVCAWGAHGAFAVAPQASAPPPSSAAVADGAASDGAAPVRARSAAWSVTDDHFAPALHVEHVVDSTGAGDTFNAGVIAALGSGHDVATALHDGCHVAGLKVQQDGFEGLGSKLDRAAAGGVNKRRRDDA